MSSFKLTKKIKYFNFHNTLTPNYKPQKDKENYITHNSLSSNNYLKIIELCSKKLSKNKNNKRALLLRASIYIKLNKFEKAENDLQSLLNDKNLASTAFYLLGIIKKEINNNELALEYFSKSIELDNNNINAYFSRGAVNNILGNYKDAIKDYNDAIYKDTLNTDGKNVYKNISKIYAQTLHNQKKISRKKERRNSLINNRNNNYIINKFQIIYNTDKNKNKNKNKIRCSSEENNLKIKKYSKYNNVFKTEIDENLQNSQKKIKNIVVNSTSNNFNFFIRNIAYKKNNEKYCDTYNLLKEICGYLNEEDNEENFSINMLSHDRKKENINNRNKDIFRKSITSVINEKLSNFKNQNISSSLITDIASNISNELINMNKTPSAIKFQNTIFNNLNEINKNKSTNIKKSKSLFFDNNSQSEINLNNTINNSIFYNSQKAKSNNNIYINGNNIINKEQNNSLINNNQIIEKNSNNLKTYKGIEKEKDILTNSPSYESSKSIFNYTNELKNNNNRLVFSPNEKNLYLFSEKIPKNNLEINENYLEDEILCIKGENERNKGNYNEAIEFFTKSIQLNPKSFKAFFNRAFTYDKIGLYNEAICDYTSTIRLKPNHSFCFYNRGITYNKIGDYEKSIYDFSKAIELEPNKPEFYFNRACLYKNTKQYQNAINDYTIVIKLFPKLYTPVYNRGICYEKSKKYQSSIKDFETCIQMAENNIHPYYQLATIYKILQE